MINVALKEGTGIYYKEPLCVPKYAFLRNLLFLKKKYDKESEILKEVVSAYKIS